METENSSTNVISIQDSLMEVVTTEESTVVTITTGIDTISVVNSESLQPVIIEVNPITEVTVIHSETSQGNAGPPGIQGEQGIPGPPGGVGSTNFISLISGGTLSGHRVVKTNNLGYLEYADNTDITSLDKIIGITINSSTYPEQAIIQVLGELIEPSWDWDTTLGVYLGINGNITQLVPTEGFICSIGTVISPTSIFINIKQSIELG